MHGAASATLQICIGMLPMPHRDLSINTEIHIYEYSQSEKAQTSLAIDICGESKDALPGPCMH